MDRADEDTSTYGCNPGAFMFGCMSGLFPPLAFVVFLISAPIYIISKVGLKKQFAFWSMIGSAIALGLGFAFIRSGFMNF